MSAENEGVTLPEVNRNVVELRRKLDDITMNFVPMNVWQENQKLVDANRLETGRRIGAIENELAEKRKAFTNSLLYPGLIALMGAGAGALAIKIAGG